MTRKELIEENATLREALHSIADTIEDVLGEAEEDLVEDDS